MPARAIDDTITPPPDPQDPGPGRLAPADRGDVPLDDDARWSLFLTAWSAIAISYRNMLASCAAALERDNAYLLRVLREETARRVRAEKERDDCLLLRDMDAEDLVTLNLKRHEIAAMAIVNGAQHDEIERLKSTVNALGRELLARMP